MAAPEDRGRGSRKRGRGEGRASSSPGAGSRADDQAPRGRSKARCGEARSFSSTERLVRVMTWIPEEFVELNRQLYPDFAWPALGEEEVRFVNDEPMPSGWTNGESITLNVAHCTTDDLLLKEN